MNNTSNIPRTMVVELNYDNAKNQTSSSQWTNAISPTITLEEGDTMIMKQCFINVGTTESNVVLFEDVNFSLVFGHYINVCDENKGSLGTGSPDGTNWGHFRSLNLYYLVRNLASLLPPADDAAGLFFANSMSINLSLPKGSYSYQAIADELTAQLAQKSFNLDFGESGLFGFSELNFWCSDWAFVNQPDPDLRREYRWVKDGLPPYTPQAFGPDADLGLEAPNILWYENFGNHRPPAGLAWFGSTQPAIVYDSTINRFKFIFFTPPLDNNGEWVAKMIIQDPNAGGGGGFGPYYYGSISGSYLQSYNDDPSGFVKNVLRLNDRTLTPVTHGYDPQQPIAPKISSLLGTNDLFMQSIDGTNHPQNYYSGGPFGPQVGTYSAKTTNVYTPPAGMSDELFSSTVLGRFYLISIQSILQNTLYSSDGNNLGLTAIVSPAYNSSNIITGYSDGSSLYIHKGAPVTLENFEVSILDPVTKLPSTLIGDSLHTVYLEIQKAQN